MKEEDLDELWTLLRARLSLHQRQEDAARRGYK